VFGLFFISLRVGGVYEDVRRGGGEEFSVASYAVE
jgi:hypothetical protein